MPNCGGLGIYRRRAFITEAKLCLRGLHRVTGYNAEQVPSGVMCRRCHINRSLRWRWAKRLDMYWRELHSPIGPVTLDEVLPITTSGAGSSGGGRSERPSRAQP